MVFLNWLFFRFVYIPVRLLTRILMGRKRRQQLFWSKGWFGGTRMLMQLLRRLGFSLAAVYYLQEAKVIRSLMKLEGNIAVDVGANIGYYSILLSRRFQRIYAIEPHPKTAECLYSNLIRNHLQDRHKIERVAVSDYEGEAELFLSWHSSVHSLFPKQMDRGSVKVRVTTLDSLLDEFTRIDLIKIDVEGAEWEVLRGSERIMSKVRNWMIEVHKEHQKRQFEGKFQEYGYKTRWVDQHHILAYRANNT